MPTGMYIRRRHDNSFKREYPLPISGVCIEWLAHVASTANIDIQHARNKGEFRVGPRRIPVDGFCR